MVVEEVILDNEKCLKIEAGVCMDNSCTGEY